MLMATTKKRRFLNFEVDDQVLDRLDETAQVSNVTRSEQARVLIEYGLGIERKPFIPIAQPNGLPFKNPTDEAPGRRKRRSRR